MRDRGAIAQLGERLDRTQEVGGSSPPSSILICRYFSKAAERPPLSCNPCATRAFTCESDKRTKRRVSICRLYCCARGTRGGPESSGIPPSSMTIPVGEKHEDQVEAQAPGGPSAACSSRRLA